MRNGIPFAGSALVLISLLTLLGYWSKKQEKVSEKPRLIISSDIGGTDPDDNQSMIHFLMYSDRFQTEGLISSPSYGAGSKEEILNMIALYEKDLPKLKPHASGFPDPDSLRAVVKQGQGGLAPFVGYQTATEGSDWIVECARREREQPLWILVWGGLEDLAQALHDAPEIQSKIKVYWIGGPNKKWSTNSYAYIAGHFPDLWFIEANAVYRGFFSNTKAVDSLKNENYYGHFINEAGHLGQRFQSYYKGSIKMGDTPSLLYLMNGDPYDPLGDSWGGSFQNIRHSPRSFFHRHTSLNDTVSVFSIVEYRFAGPQLNIPPDSACFTMVVSAGMGEQQWSGYYLGHGQYAIRYAPKKAETLSYTLTSEIPGFPGGEGQLVVTNTWPGEGSADDFPLGENWYTDPSDPALFDKGWQGAKTVLKWRKEVLLDWARRWEWLK
jgi:hypothetical protein